MNDPRLRRLLAVGLLLALLAVLAGGLLLPLLARWNAAGERREQLQGQLEVYRRMAAGLPEQQARLERLRGAAPPAALTLGETRPALAGADLQQRVGQLVSQSGGQLVSTQILERGDPAAALPAVTLKVQMRGETEQLVRLLHALAYSRPLLVVDNLLVLANPRLDMQRIYSGSERPVLPALDVTFEVTAFMAGRSGE